MKQATRRGQPSSVNEAPLNQRLKEGGFILLSSLAIYFLISLLTYHQGDPGWSHSGMSPDIQNAAGRTGAWFSDFFYSLFGYMAYMFPAAFALGGFFLYQDRTSKESTSSLMWTIRSFGLLFTLLAGCGLVAMHGVHLAASLPMSAGGLLGSMIQGILVPYSSLVGTTLILGAILLVGVTLLTGFSWLTLFEIVGHHSLKGLAKAQSAGVEKAKQMSFPDWELPKLFLPSKKNVQTDFEDFDEEPDHDEEHEHDGVQDNADEAADLLFLDKKPKPKKVSIKKTTPVAPRLEKAVAPVITLPPVMKQSKENVSPKPFKGTLSLELLDDVQPAQKQGYTSQQLHELARLVESRLLEFGVDAKVVGVLPGPVITRFELDLAAGIKVNKITGLAKDLARSLSVVSVRVVEVIPGKSVVGLEIPNVHREIVRLKEILRDPIYERATSPVTLALGKDIAGRSVAVDLAKMPHLLVAGTTGSGKSVGLNAMLLSILYKATPEDARLILIDPKMLELAVYDNIPHLLTPVVTDMKDAANALRWCVGEMDRRYQLMAALGVRNLAGYNQKVEEALKANKPLLDPLWHPRSQEKPEPLAKLPVIVVVVDEFADMIMVVGKKVEELIARIAQKARAAGIHLILATQRPSVDVITGLIKANIPTRIAFQVSSRIDSRTILDQSGAEQLLGHGDMLYLPPGVGVPHRIHGAFVSDEEVNKVTQELRNLGSPTYIENIVQATPTVGSHPDDDDYDEFYDQAVAIVTEARKASISLVQRRLKIGYNRAARLIEKMESEGVVSSMQSNGTREVIAPPYVE